MGKHWTTDTQKAWLSSKIDDFISARGASRIDRFHITLHKEWFGRWPEHDIVFPSKSKEETLTAEEQGILGLAVDARQKQISSWFYNATASRSISSTQAVKVFTAAVKAETQEIGSKHAPQAVEVYQKLFRKKIEDAISEKAQIVNAKSNGESLAVRRKVSQALMNAETDETKNLLQEEIKQWKEKKREVLLKIAELEKNGLVSKTPEEYETALKALPGILNRTLQACADATGWVFTVAAGGPVPSVGGHIHMQHYYAGPKTSENKTFRKAHADFENGMVKPFTAHLVNCFSPEVRSARAMTMALGLDAEVIQTSNEVIPTADDKITGNVDQEAVHMQVEPEHEHEHNDEGTDWDEIANLCDEWDARHEPISTGSHVDDLSAGLLDDFMARTGGTNWLLPPPIDNTVITSQTFEPVTDHTAWNAPMTMTPPLFNLGLLAASAHIPIDSSAHPTGTSNPGVDPCTDFHNRSAIWESDPEGLLLSISSTSTASSNVGYDNMVTPDTALVSGIPSPSKSNKPMMAFDYVLHGVLMPTNALPALNHPLATTPPSHGLPVHTLTEGVDHSNLVHNDNKQVENMQDAENVPTSAKNTGTTKTGATKRKHGDVVDSSGPSSNKRRSHATRPMCSLTKVHVAAPVPTKKKGKKECWYYEDEDGNEVDKAGNRIVGGV